MRQFEFNNKRSNERATITAPSMAEAARIYARQRDVIFVSLDTHRKGERSALFEYGDGAFAYAATVRQIGYMPRPKKNPASVRIPPSVRARLDAASRRYEKFSGHKAELVEVVPFPENPKAAVVIGELIEVGYVTVRDGKREHYRHTFRAKSRPLLVTSFDGKQLFILGGEYSFTERGIEDE